MAFPAEASTGSAHFPPGGNEAQRLEVQVRLEECLHRNRESLAISARHIWGGANPGMLFLQALHANDDPRAPLIAALEELAHIASGNHTPLLCWTIEDLRMAEAAAAGPAQETPKALAAAADEAATGLVPSVEELRTLEEAWSGFQAARARDRLPSTMSDAMRILQASDIAQFGRIWEEIRGSRPS